MKSTTLLLLAIAAAAPQARADETTRLSNALGGGAGAAESADPTISADGTVVAFVSSANDLVAGDTNFARDVFVHDRASGTTTRVSVASDGTQSNGDSYLPVLSGNGRFVAFESVASNLDVDPNGVVADVFVHDRASGITRLVSIDPAKTGADGPSRTPSIDHDGGRIAFHSTATNLVAGDANGAQDVFVLDVASGTFLVASTSADGSPADGASLSPILSGDGNVVAFMSFATTFPSAPPQGFAGIYAKDLSSGAIERIDVDSDGHPEDDDEVELHPPSGISHDGSLITIATGFELEHGDENHAFDVYLRDRAAGTTERVGLTWLGEAPASGATSGKLSADGRYVVFHSDSQDVVPDDTNGRSDVFLRDRLHGVTTRLSVGSDDEEGSERSFTTFVAGNAVSDDGSRFVFESFATDFAPGDGNGSFDVFLRERCGAAASWTRYGAGFPGRGGAIPSLAPRDAPVRGKATAIDATCSSASYTIGFVFVGLARASLPTSLGGTLLVDPLLAFPLGLTPYGGSFPATIPAEGWACGLAVDLQLLELDPWAAEGVSFSEGLELVMGD